ncbi:8-oxoguanine DNA glycosylase [Penicillium alfredii]|uniref:DNA-(apurinic or apyrimidinic site) lyase n=1 Tax=Penicillium alfredii TaxID=1506179 RepID=A0A9W9FRP1_9EURO|nr:8-oxoguanine DNA glycosylase [Penicillium alfredii]KAJ5105079.1 8-oxoguanine DNA glycosylase [Penicillium alfredii]
MGFSEWRKLPVSLSELCINTTLRCGQSFRWQKISDNEEWRCVLHGRLLSLKQDSSCLYYRTIQSSSAPHPSAPAPQSSADSDLLRIVQHYFNLSSNLTDLYTQWSSQDPNFKKKAAQFTGIRILRQDAWEALVSFICSSNNNIARISQMVEKLCLHYGPFIATIEGRAYHDFPSPEALAGKDVESNLRSLGFGYRAKYIYQTAVIVSRDREDGWLDGLSNPESPALGVESRPGDEMKPQGRPGYREAHESLLELQGVGPKVADCVCLMGLGWGESVPVDTHVWQIAQRDYRFGKSSQKTLNKATYDAVGNHFRKLWGKEAGWAHSVLFTADLRSFADRLAATKKVDVDVKDSKSQVEIKTEVTTAVGLKAPKEEDVEIKVEDALEEATKRGKKRKGQSDGVVHASKTVETRRVSKRLRDKP